MQFAQSIGHSEIKSKLSGIVNNNRLAHALLFTGPQGNGKLELAIALAQYINCQQPNNNDSCGECSSCKKYAKLIHPDLHFVFPVIKGSSSKETVSDDYMREWLSALNDNKHITLREWQNVITQDGKNKKAAIFASESNEIIKKLSYKRYEGKYKVMIIWMPEKMNEHCANKILKILEEPTSDTVFILVSDNPEQLLQTIISRTQQINIPRYTDSDITDYLIKEQGVSNDNAASFARISNGSISDAIEQVKTSKDNEVFFEYFTSLMRQSYVRNIFELSSFCEKICGHTREFQHNFIMYSLKFIRENFILNYKNTDIVYMNNEQAQFATKFSPFINNINAHNIYEELSLVDSHITQNGNAKIIWFDFAIKLTVAIKQGNEAS